jgi:hypothetical protein
MQLSGVTRSRATVYLSFDSIRSWGSAYRPICSNRYKVDTDQLTSFVPTDRIIQTPHI